MPQNPHSHKMNTNIMQMFECICTSTWLILAKHTEKANEVQPYQMCEMNGRATPLLLPLHGLTFYC